MCGFDEQRVIPLSHSADKKHDIPPQTYVEHIASVESWAMDFANYVINYARENGDLFLDTIRASAEYHDLGKLDPDNQAVLKGELRARHLPIQHTEAGTAYLLDRLNFATGAALVRSHHIGLPDFVAEQNRSESEVLRDKNAETRKHIDQTLDMLLRVHNSVRPTAIVSSSKTIQGNAMLFFRLALSCLADADHFDTARHYNQDLPKKGLPLLAGERLKLLDAYVEHLKEIQQNERTPLRTEVYQGCRNADITPNMYACDSPVGTGKTTAVMAHLLNAAAEKGLRRIFVVLPFTNIIDQAVDIYRQSLVGVNECREDIVAAHHHRAEFESLELRQYSFLWHAPIVVTTAVQFFETLASNQPTALRKIHNLPGSAIFIDEAHAALPSYLWPQAWLWLKELSSNWGCHIVLGSGSLNRFWQLEEFSTPPMELPELVSSQIRSSTIRYEEDRIKYAHQADHLDLDGLTDWLKTLPGPRLLIVNTVQSAAVIADAIRNTEGKSNVEHLSTALCPRDRKITLDRVKNRLVKREDENWTLVATSCVEAGVDLSFHTGMRERCSLNSLIQIGGRINRKGEYKNAKVWDFQLRHDGLLVSHRAFDTSARVLNELFSENQVNPGSATEAMRREIRQDGLRKVSEEILKSERNLRFPDVAEKFKVIDSNTITVIVNEKLKERLKNYDKVSPSDIQNGSVQIWTDKEIKYDMQPLEGFPELRIWNLLYDDFLGYMAGVLPLLKQERTGYSFG